MTPFWLTGWLTGLLAGWLTRSAAVSKWAKRFTVFSKIILLMITDGNLMYIHNRLFWSFKCKIAPFIYIIQVCVEIKQITIVNSVFVIHKQVSDFAVWPIDQLSLILIHLSTNVWHHVLQVTAWTIIFFIESLCDEIILTSKRFSKNAGSRFWNKFQLFKADLVTWQKSHRRNFHLFSVFILN